MRLLNPESIAGKLARMNLIVCGTALIMAYMSFLFYDLYRLREILVAELGTEARIIGSNSIAPLMFDDAQAAESTLSALRGSPQVVSAIVCRPGGQVFARYDRDKTRPIDFTPRLTGDEVTGNWRYEGDRILLGRRIESENRLIGFVYILAETTDLSHRARQFGIISAAILALCYLVALLATGTIRNLIGRPLTALADTARIVSRDRDYSVRAETLAGSDELALLIQSFNDMLEQIQERDHALELSRRDLEQKVQERTAELVEANQELEAFSYSVAHDLRGPLQHIANLAYLLGQSGELKKDVEGSKLVDRIMDASGRMSSLIDDLLNLSKATSSPLHSRALDMTRMAENVVASLMADKGNRAVEITIAQGAHAFADEGLIGIVLGEPFRKRMEIYCQA